MSTSPSNPAPNNAPTPLPTYIYKILPSNPTPPSPLPPALPLSPLDARDGFIHLSTRHQLRGTLNNFFAAERHVWILRIRYEVVAPFIRWEDSKGKGPEEVGGCWDIEGKAGYFPHIYNNDPAGVGERGLKLGQDEVDAVGKFEKAEEGKAWSAVGWPWGEEDAPS